jgi:flagellar motor switch protein FliM
MEVLSQDEIDALLKGIDSNFININNKKNIKIEYEIDIEYDKKELNKVMQKWLKKNSKIKIGVIK